MKFIDFFSGIGGMRLGLEKAGHICMGFCEWDKYARKTYKAIHNTEGEWEAHDIREVKPYDVPTVPLWSFGFPCQDISIAGKQLGIRGDVQGFFGKLLDCLKGEKLKIDPNGYSLKMLEIFCLLDEVLILQDCCVRWDQSGTTANGICSTAKIITVCKIEKECSLSHILEKVVNEKYFLSDTKVTECLNKLPTSCREETEQILIKGGYMKNQV